MCLYIGLKLINLPEKRSNKNSIAKICGYIYLWLYIFVVILVIYNRNDGYIGYI